MREALFTLEVLRDPAAPLSRTWREVTTEWLGLDDDSGAFEFLDFLHPLDLKNYVFAQVLSESAFASLTAGRAEAPLSHSLVEKMVTKFYRPGNIVPWPVKFGIR